MRCGICGEQGHTRRRCPKSVHLARDLVMSVLEYLEHEHASSPRWWVLRDLRLAKQALMTAIAEGAE